MKTTDRISVEIPFGGFYESLWSEAVDSEIEQLCEHYAERDNEEQAPELRLSANEYAEILFDCTDYSAIYAAVSRSYVSAFESVFNEQTGLQLGLKFEEMTSPREYNFTTDRIFCNISFGTAKRLFARSRKDGHAMLAKIIAERFTSYDGFISSYPNALDSWLAKPLADWDHNEIGTLLRAVWALSPDFDKDWRYAVYEALTEDDGVMQELDSGVDWEKLESKIAEVRADKVAEAKESNPDYVAPPPRCPDTLELFQRH
jgi:hypothetical protein